MNASTTVVVIAICFGFWELWSAVNAGPQGAGAGFLFAALFIGGGIYGLRQMFTEYADAVIALDVADGGQARITVWRPFGSKRIEGAVAELGGWRTEAKVVGGARTPMALADHPGHTRPLRFETAPPIKISAEFRALASAAFANVDEHP